MVADCKQNVKMLKCLWYIMVRLISHSSLSNVNDVRLKGRPITTMFCGLCNLAAEDDIRHLVLQCPGWQTARGNCSVRLLEDWI